MPAGVNCYFQVNFSRPRGGELAEKKIVIRRALGNFARGFRQGQKFASP
jgi:hypothetical protein